jgi:tRNA G10  N-methylase Trm11
VPEGAIIADVTFGLGSFWTLVDQSKYQVLASDIKSGVDFTKLPYRSATMDCVVLDPPYMHYAGGTAFKNYTDFDTRYEVNMRHHETLNGHEALMELYYQGSRESYRVLKNRGILVIKCMDQVVAGKQKMSHVEIINTLSEDGFVIEDLFVVVRYGRPTISTRTIQQHARKNHSYFLVFRKTMKGKKK